MKKWTPYRSLILASAVLAAVAATAPNPTYEFNDSHFHLTNYIQEGPDIRDFLKIMGDKGRAARAVRHSACSSSGPTGSTATSRRPITCRPTRRSTTTRSPTRGSRWRTVAPPKDQQARFDPMITGFNPTDMYAADHIRRVLQTFPGVFAGIGEFSIHKEFVSAKIAGEVASLQDPALDRLLDFAAEVGLVVLIHNDIDMPFAKEGSTPAYLDQMKAVFKRASATRPSSGRISGWGESCGRSRITRRSSKRSCRIPLSVTSTSTLSWDEVAKYVVVEPGRDQDRRPISSTAIPTASCSAPTKSPRPARRNI